MEKRKETLSGSQMCRFCLSQTTPLINFYEKSQSPRDPANIKFKILSCLSVEVFPSDKMPAYICERCKFFMNIFHDFKKVCRQADEAILKYIQNGTALQAMSWPRQLLKLHSNSKKESVVKTVVESGATVQVSSQDTSDTEDEDANVYNVKIGDGNDEAKTTQVKVITSDQVEKPKTSRKEAELDKGCWPCDECDRTYPLQQMLQLHKRQKHRERNIQCNQCDAKFFTKYDLMTHQLRHSDEMPFQCVACDKKFKRLIILKRHEKIMHADLPQQSCPKCPATFLSYEELTAHQQRHNRPNNRSYKCDICTKTFNVKSGLQRHKDTVHNKVPEFKCEYCPERFGSIPKLARHVRTHAGERPYPCKYCDKSFLKSQHYTRHLRIKHRDNVRSSRNQDQDDSYPCEQCEEIFITQDDLIYHSAIHATQNLICPLCEEKFENVDSVTTHIKSHVNGLEFMCDFCELIFTTKDKYENHLMIAHEEEIQNELGEEESSMEVQGDGIEDDEDDNSIQVKDAGDHMVIEIKKADNFMLNQEAPEESEYRGDNTNSEESEAETLALVTPALEPSPVVTITNTKELATVEKVQRAKQILPQATVISTQVEAKALVSTQATIVPIQTAQPKTVVANQPKSTKASVITKANNQPTLTIRKLEDIKRKAVEPPAEIQAKKEKVNKVESSNSAGFSDKSLRLLEKELQDLKRTNSRSDVTKTPPVKAVDTPKSRRPQIITSTPKLRSNDDKKSQLQTKSPAFEKKQIEKRVTKENKEPKEAKEMKNNGNKKDEEKEKESKETPKSVIKNGTSDKSASDEGIRRSTRPSKIKDYAKMIRDRSHGNSDDDDSDMDDEEYTESTPEPRQKRRASVKTTPKPTPPASVATTPTATPTPRKRGRPRKDANKEVPEKIKKDENTAIESNTQKEDESKPIEEVKSEKPEITATIPSNTTGSEQASTEQKSQSNVILSPTGQTLKKVPIKALPPGVKPMPLPMNARPMGQGELCEMQIGKKVVKVQKIVMTKAEVEAMAKKGLVEMKDGTMVLKQGIKLPTATAGNKDVKDSPTKKEKAVPTRCDLGDD
ncbi:RE1-silencing transcription factor-like isoform X3 [Colias croceus]|uniref:RE1-silencing transcription factor-like isoform X3 n=1 Tax=Colias crocea TaxID=72248 RepID=UPI001E2807FF|nr:RE1-silencing transcription factor-like isoform X3 [Colias croceus]